MGAKVFMDQRLFSGRQPEPCLRAQSSHFDDGQQMGHVLDVPGIMPAEMGFSLVLDQEGHGLRPAGVSDGIQPPVLGGLDVAELVPALQGVAVRADGIRDLGQLAPDLALFGGEAIPMAGHLGGFG